MKRKFLNVLLILGITATAIGCGKDTEPVESITSVIEETKAPDEPDYAIETENVKVAQYKGLSMEKQDTTVTEKDIDDFINYLLQYTYLPDEENKASEEIENADGDLDKTNVSLGTPLTSSDLTDAIVEIISDNEYSTVEDYRNYIKDTISAQNELYFTDLAKNQLFQTVVDGSELISYPDDDLNVYIEYANTYYKDYAKYAGYEVFDEFVTDGMGFKDIDEFNVFVKKESLSDLKSEYIIRAIADKEGIEVSDEEVKKEIQRYIDDNYFETEEAVLDYITRDEIIMNLKYDKVLEVIYNSAKFEVVESESNDAPVEDNGELLSSDLIVP